MSQRAPAIFVTLGLVAVLLAAGCQRKVISEQYRPSTGSPVGTSVPFNQPYQPMDLVGSSGGGAGKQMPAGMQSMFDWTKRHNTSSGPRFTPQTLGSD